MPTKNKRSIVPDDYVPPPRPKPILTVSPQGIEAFRYEIGMSDLPAGWKAFYYNPDEKKDHSLFYYNPYTRDSLYVYETPKSSEMFVQHPGHPQDFYMINNNPETRQEIEYTKEQYEEYGKLLNEALPYFDDEPHANDSEYFSDPEVARFLESQDYLPDPRHVPYEPDDHLDLNYSRTHELGERARLRLKNEGRYSSDTESGTESGTEPDITFGDLTPDELNYMPP